MMDSGKYTVSVDQLLKIMIKLFMAAGYDRQDAAYATSVLVETDRRGVDTHGVARFGLYYKSTVSGRVKKDALLHIQRDDPPFLMVDADNGLGIIMAYKATELAIQRAKEQGVCIMGVQNSNHFGAAGYYAAKCANEGFITIVSSNSPPIAAPLGGKTNILGNSPWSMAIPGGIRHPAPLMFDMACSEVSRGKCETAAREGRNIPQGWGLDNNGEPTTDPADVLKGSLLPFGGVKGYCILMLVEAFSSLLTFASYGNGTNMGNSRYNTSHFLLLMDPAKFGDPVAFKESIDVYVENIKNSPLAAGVDEIIIPGELESRAIKHNDEHGINLDEAIADSLAEAAVSCGLVEEGPDCFARLFMTGE